MKRARAAWLTLAILLLLAVLLVLFLPARWVAPLVQSRLHGLVLDGVHGLAWDGAAEDVRGFDGRRVGRVRWQLSRSALWGRLDLQLDVDGPGFAARGRLRRDAQGRPVWSDVTLRTGLARWTPQLDSPWGTPQGALTVTLQRAVLQGSWPLDLAGQAHWQDAAMLVHGSRIALGRLDMDLAATNGVLRGRLHDADGGPLRADGQWQASPLGWRLDLLLQPRTADPALRHWLARIGHPQPDGSIRLHRRGGLAAATPETTP